MIRKTEKNPGQQIRVMQRPQTGDSRAGRIGEQKNAEMETPPLAGPRFRRGATEEQATKRENTPLIGVVAHAVKH